MYTDADIEMAELAEAGNMIAAGVCPMCECPLDPTHPKWAGQFDTHRVLRDGKVTTEPWSPEQEADMVGPAVKDPSFHDRCMADAMREHEEDQRWREEARANG